MSGVIIKKNISERARGSPLGPNGGKKIQQNYSGRERSEVATGFSLAGTATL